MGLVRAACYTSGFWLSIVIIVEMLIEHHWLTFLACCIMHIHDLTWHTLVRNILAESEMVVTTDATMSLEVRRTISTYLNMYAAVCCFFTVWQVEPSYTFERIMQSVYSSSAAWPWVVLHWWLQGRVDLVRWWVKNIYRVYRSLAAEGSACWSILP